jgi:MFS family permease
VSDTWSLGVLRERQFALFFWGQAVSVLGDGIFPIALAFAVLELGGSPTDLGIVLTAGILPQTLFVLVGGVWADRLPRRTIMLVSDAARAVIQAVTAVLLLSGHAQIWHLVVLYGP